MNDLLLYKLPIDRSVYSTKIAMTIIPRLPRIDRYGFTLSLRKNKSSSSSSRDCSLTLILTLASALAELNHPSCISSE
jgi:hypothetical protein